MAGRLLFSMEQIFYISRLLVEKLRERQLPTKISINESAALNREDYVFDFYRKLLADDTLYPYIDHLPDTAIIPRRKISAACIDIYRIPRMRWGKHLCLSIKRNGRRGISMKHWMTSGG